PVHEDVESGLRVKNLEARLVGMVAFRPAVERDPLGLRPRRVGAVSRDLEIVGRLDGGRRSTLLLRRPGFRRTGDEERAEEKWCSHGREPTAPKRADQEFSSR